METERKIEIALFDNGYNPFEIIRLLINGNISIID